MTFPVLPRRSFHKLLASSLAFPCFANLSQCRSENSPVSLAENPATRDLVIANNRFTFQFFQALESVAAGQSMFFSPYSIESALLMTMEGARHQTAAEMGKVLAIPGQWFRQGESVPWDLGSLRSEIQSTQKQFSKPDAKRDSQATNQIADLQKKLATANQKGNDFYRAGKFKEGTEQAALAESLAEKINQLQKTVNPYELKIANGIWSEKTLPILKSFVDTLREHYDASAESLDFVHAPEAQRTYINEWISKQTNRKINDMIPMGVLDSRTRMVLANAIYFKGTWEEPFQEKQTQPKDFFNQGKTKTQVPTMSKYTKVGRYAAFNADGTPFETPSSLPQGTSEAKGYPKKGILAVELPYNGGDIAMTIYLPTERDGMEAMMRVVTADRLVEWQASMVQRDFHLSLPRFKMETKYELNQVLKQMGMVQAFDADKADFSGLCASPNPDHQLHISRVLHNAFVEVNEKGTEAAAATVVIMAPRSAMVREIPFIPAFVADHPFLFTIHNRHTGLILFLGKVEQI